MKLAANEPLVKFEEDTLLPKVPSNKQSEQFFLEFVSYVQQWGVMISIVAFILCLIVAMLFKVRKNPQGQRVWRFFGYGFVFIAIICAVLPYIALRFY